MPHGIINHFIRTAKHAAWSLNKQFTIPNTGHLVIRCKPFTTIGIILYSMFKDTINDHCDQKVFCSLKPFLLFKKARLWLRHTYNDKQQQELKFISTTSIFLWPFPQSWWRGPVVERGLWLANFPCPALDLQLMGDHYVGKPSATGQPTRPTQPFILSGSINE